MSSQNEGKLTAIKTVKLELELEPKYLMLVIVFLFLVFAFVTPYELDYSTRQDDVNTLVAASEEGSPARRLGMPFLGLFGIGVCFLKIRRKFTINGSLGVAFYLYLLVAFASLAWAEEPLLTMRKLVVLVLLMFGSLGVATLLSMREIMIYVATTCGGVMVLALGCELYHGTFLQAKEYSIYQLAGIMHPNALSCYISSFIIAVVALMGQSQRKQLFYLVLIGAGFTFLFLAKSRTSLFCTVVVGLMIWLPTSTLPRRLAGILSAGLIVCALAIGLQDKFEEKVNSTIFMGRESEEGASTLTNRTPLWNEVMTYIEKRPWLGYGYDSFWTPYRVYIISQHQGWEVPHSHNGYFELTLSMGLIGLGLYLATIGILIVKTVSSYLKTKDLAHLYALGMIIWLCFEMVLEKVYMNPVFPSFICNLLITRYAFVQEQEWTMTLSHDENQDLWGELEPVKSL